VTAPAFLNWALSLLAPAGGRGFGHGPRPGPAGPEAGARATPGGRPGNGTAIPGSVRNYAPFGLPSSFITSAT